MLKPRSLRLLAVSFVSVCSLLFLTARTPWQIRPSSLYWPSTPDLWEIKSSPRWLLAIFVSPQDVAHREAIRQTWASRYKSPLIDYRFVLGGSDDPELAQTVRAENATYADMWVLEDFRNEDWQSANKNKNMEFFKFMVREQGNSVGKYDFVSKVDSDSWVSVPLYFDTFIAPRLPGGDEYDPDALTVIGRPMVWDSPYAYASGRIYTLSWPLLEFLAAKYVAEPNLDLSEDKMMGMYLYENRTAHRFVVLEVEQAWDLGREGILDGSNQTFTIHAVKQPERMYDLNALFDDQGRWNGKTLSGVTSFNRTMSDVVKLIGEPMEDQLRQLQAEWADDGGVVRQPRETLDYHLIINKTDVENRMRMGDMYPLNLPGNNVSLGIVPQMLKPINMSRMNG